LIYETPHLLKIKPENWPAGGKHQAKILQADRFGNFEAVAFLVAAVLVVVFAALISFILDRNSIYIFKGVGSAANHEDPKLGLTPWTCYASGTASAWQFLLTGRLQDTLE
jgi:hypothetical protein